MKDPRLSMYQRKRDFLKTPEPPGQEEEKKKGKSHFVIQRHDARQLHYDLRLEAGGVLKSWAVPKGPSLNPRATRLAMETEDHPLEYAGFEGVIPEGEYGAGTVLIWDEGTFDPKNPVLESYKKGKIEFVLEGKRLKGAFVLVRTHGGKKPRWLLKKKADEFASGGKVENGISVSSGKTVEEIAEAWDLQSHPLASLVPEQFQKRLRGSKLPDWAPPMFAFPWKGRVPVGEWVFERKLDGERCMIRVEKGRVDLISRNQKSLNATYPELREEFASQITEDCLLDAEIVAFDEERTSFAKLQERMHIAEEQKARASRIPVFCYLFDILFLQSYDVRPLPLLVRKLLLHKLLEVADPIRFTTPQWGQGEQLLEEACRIGWEGLIAKRADSPYSPTRSRDWIKLKCGNEQEFVIGGFTEGEREGFGALLVGYYEGNELRYAGKVGTGFSAITLEDLAEKLLNLEVPDSPFADVPGERNVRWVKPELVAQIGFSEWTRDGRLRHGRFLGLRRDKEPVEVTRE